MYLQIIIFLFLLTALDTSAQNRATWDTLHKDTLYHAVYRLKIPKKPDTLINIVVYYSKKLGIINGIDLYEYRKYTKLKNTKFFYCCNDTATLNVYNGWRGQSFPFVRYPKNGNEKIYQDVSELRYYEKNGNISNVNRFWSKLTNSCIFLIGSDAYKTDSTSSTGIFCYNYYFRRKNCQKKYKPQYRRPPYWRLVLHYSPSTWITYVAGYKKGKLKHELFLVSLKKYSK